MSSRHSTLVRVVSTDAVDAPLVLQQIPPPRKAARVAVAARVRTEVLHDRTVPVADLVHFALVPEEPANVAKGRGLAVGLVAAVRSVMSIQMLL